MKTSTFKIDIKKELFPINDFVILPNGEPGKVIGFSKYDKERIVKDDHGVTHNISVDKLKNKCGYVARYLFSKWLSKNQKTLRYMFKWNKLLAYILRGILWFQQTNIKT